MLHQHGISFSAHLNAVGSHFPPHSIPPACRNTPYSSKSNMPKHIQDHEAESVQ